MPTRRNPPSRRLLGAALALAACVHRRGDDPGPTPVPVDLVRARIASHTCAVWSAEADQWSLELLSEQCEAAADDTGPAAAIDAAVAATRPLVVLGSRAYDRFHAAAVAGRSQAVADALAREAFWSDPVLSGAILLRAQDELAARGMRCDGCPALVPPATIAMSWAQFQPYLLAYVWPTQRTPDAEVELLVCSAENGAAALPAGDAQRQAGFLAAASLADDAAMHRAIADLRATHNLQASRSAAGLAREVAALLASPAGRGRVCEALADVAWFTGVVVRDCPARAGP